VLNNEFEVKLELKANKDPKNDAKSDYVLNIKTDNKQSYIYIKSMSIPRILYGSKTVDGYELVNETLQQ
jgi:hypothetical protein